MKLLRLFGAIFVMSLKRDLAFRTNLLFQLLLVVTTTGSSLFAVDIVYTRTQTLGGWHAGEAIVLIGTFTIVSGLLQTFVEPNVTWFNQRIESGQIDEVLLRPVPSLFLASLGRHAPAGLIQIAVGIAVVGWGMRGLEAGWELANAVAWLILLLAGFALTWGTRTLIAMLALWVPGLALDVVYDGVWQFGRYPVTIYRQPAAGPVRPVLGAAVRVHHHAAGPRPDPRRERSHAGAQPGPRGGRGRLGALCLDRRSASLHERDELVVCHG